MTVVARPRSERVIPLLEILRTKKQNILGKCKAKARSVARGDLEQRCEDFSSPVASILGLRIFICLSIQFAGGIRHSDVKNAFLYGRLDRPLHLELPRGHPNEDGNRLVWRTKTAIYGLVESP